MEQQSILGIVTSIASIITPLLLIALSGIGWIFKNKLERTYELEKSLRTERIDIYNGILEPFIVLFTPDEGIPKDKISKGKTKQDIAREKMLSLEYKRTAFELALIGSDHLLRAYNDLMQHFFQSHENPSQEESARAISLLGKFLLEIRKSVGNQKTDLHHFEMLEWFVSDIRKFRIDGEYKSLN